MSSIRQYLFTQLSKLSLSSQLERLRPIESPFFIICLHGSLHLVDLCLKYFPANQKVVLISNGLSKWEIAWAKKNLKVDDFLFLPKRVVHGVVLDLLIGSLEHPFGLLDYDCFVFNPSLFFRLSSINPQSMLNALFVYSNNALNLDFPESYMLFLNPKLIRAIQNKYGVNSKVIDYQSLSPQVKNKLLEIQIDDNHLPEGHKKYFDTMRLWIALGFADGYTCNFIERYPTVSDPSNEIYHVGCGSSHRLDVISKWEARGAYFWWRALESTNKWDLQQYYWHEFGKHKSQDVLIRNPDTVGKLGKNYFDQVETIISTQ